MTKISKFICFAYSVFLGLLMTACVQNENKTPDKKLIDLRNKTSNGTIYRAADDTEFSCVFDEENSDIPDTTTAWAKDTITVSDCDQGIKFTFQKPSAYDDYFLDWFDIHIVNSNGQEYARTSLDESSKNGYDSEGKIDIIYPLVLPGKDVLMYVEYGFTNSSYWPYHVIKLAYKIHTVHGMAMPDALPDDFDCSDNIELNEGRYIRIFDIIPPEGDNLKICVGLWEHDEGKENNDRISYKAIPESDWTTTDTVTKSDKEIVIDCSKFSNPARNKPYIYGDFLFTYTLEDFPGQTFGTVTFISKAYENTFFRNDNE